MAIATNLGFPRIGAKRELKKATEKYWKGDISAAELLEAGTSIRVQNWQTQKEAGLQHIPANDFSFYDQVLDMIATLGAVPSRYNWSGENVDLETYFAMARGRQQGGVDVVAMEMTKWFDTNYHYIVPEFEEGQTFKLSSDKIFDEFMEAKETLGLAPRPVIIGPATFVFLGKARYDAFSARDTVEQLLPIYEQILQKLESLGAEWVQIDEPMLALDVCPEASKVFQNAYTRLSNASNLKILLATYFEGLRDNLTTACQLPVDGLHVDLVRAPDQFGDILDSLPADKVLSLGVVDGRNVWRNDLSSSLAILEKAANTRGADNLFVAPSCSMIHSPIDLDNETSLDDELKSWMAFAKQKLSEITALTTALNGDKAAVADIFKTSDSAANARKTSTRIHNKGVKERAAAITPDMYERKNKFDTRQTLQREALGLPNFPTTTIGSFPQTKEIRKARADYKKDAIDFATYEAAMNKEIAEVVKYQEEVDIDVLVHGEAERNDMVEYFGEQLEGFTFTKLGWVQSYGSRYVKPPIIFGDVSRPEAMTVKWSAYAQSLTDRRMKGMLTGPITILCWSFVRNDQPRSETCKQIGLAIRDEVCDLEAAGIKVIQIDEPAIREGLPLRKNDWAHYLEWSVNAFKLSAAGVEDTTQIHTHMCYSEFNDIIDSIGNMDADVISIETSRSHMELLDAFVEYKYPNEIGPGVYDIHSPRIPSTDEMVALLNKAVAVLNPDQIWVNPDCGLKTRGWAEVKPALENMVKAAKVLRDKTANKAAA